MAGKQGNKVNPERRRQGFTREFNLEAVRQLELGLKPATQLALELGVQRGQLYKWQAQAKAGGTLQAPFLVVPRQHGFINIGEIESDPIFPYPVNFRLATDHVKVGLLLPSTGARKMGLEPLL